MNLLWTTVASVCLVLFPIAPRALAQDQKEKDLNAVLEQIRANYEATTAYKKFSKSPTSYIETETDIVFAANPQEARVLSLVPATALMGILVDGEFKNQHQTGYSGGGGFDPEARLKIEERLSGVDLKKQFPTREQLHEILPKYGLVEFPDFSSHPKVLEGWAGELGSSIDSDQYGEIAVYFKDSIKSRTTFAAKDSGELRKNDKIQSLRQEKMILDYGSTTDGSYFEAQIWGKVTLADIDFILLPKDFVSDNSPVSMKDLERALKSTGIAVYREKPQRKMTELERQMSDARMRIRGDLIFPEDPSKRTRFAANSSCAKLLRKLVGEMR